MIKNYLKIALRSLWRSKVHSLINIMGLSLGIACCLLIALYVDDEWSFDQFHSKANRIYRVYVKEDWGENQQFFNTSTPFPMGPVLKENLAEVEGQVRINPMGTQLKIAEKIFNEQVVVVGQELLDVFDFEVLNGDRNSLKSQPNIVITQRMAEKYFGSANPIDQPVAIQLGENFEEFTVKAVVANVPNNSSIQFDIAISDLNFPKIVDHRTLTSGWFNISPETYVLLKEGISATDVEAKFPSLFKTLLGEADFNQSKYAPGLQPITTIHLDSSFPAGIAPVSNSRYSYILAAIAILILFVGCINFVTLSVGRSIQRAKEVGIRKVVGAQRSQIIFQFIGEAIIVTSFSMVIGCVVSFLCLPGFNDLAAKQLVFPWNGFLLVTVLLLLVVIGFFAGSYPALILSGFQPISILKGKVQAASTRQGLRKALVGLQLVLSVFLIASTLIMQSQLQFLRDKDLGFSKEQVAVVPLRVPRMGGLAEGVNKGFEMAQQYKGELLKIPGVNAVCAASHDFGNGNWTSIGYTDENKVYRNFTMNVIDAAYIPSMKIAMAQGRNFSDENPADKRRSVIVNESFVKELGWIDAVGKRIPGKGFIDHEVIGVVKDFHFESLYTKVQPLVLVQDPSIVLSGSENISINNSPIPKLFIHIAPGEIQSVLAKVETVWTALSDGEFSFSFVDQSLAAQYRADQNLGKIVRVATALAILIGGLGLYGLASLAMQNRVKEISIRKVLGANERSLLVLLSKEYILLIGISLVISVPITLYLMNEWLKGFEYKIEIGAYYFLLAGVISLSIALLAIGYQTIRTALAQPADTLKYE